jgi:hypothetical protein
MNERFHNLKGTVACDFLVYGFFTGPTPNMPLILKPFVEFGFDFAKIFELEAYLLGGRKVCESDTFSQASRK